MSRFQSPGPIYKLPPTVGYKDHDFSRHRYPMYSIGMKVYPPEGKSHFPGPQYQVTGMTEHGKANPPAYSLTSKPKDFKRFEGPGPGAHSPEKCPRMKEQRPPAYSMGSRRDMAHATIGPGPLSYTLPSMLGPKVPTKRANGAYTMSSRYFTKGTDRSPGPAAYGGVNSDVYREKKPLYSMRGKFHLGSKEQSPGPAAYLPKPGRCDGGPAYSMRSRNMATSPYVTAQDQMPCD